MKKYVLSFALLSAVCTSAVAQEDVNDYFDMSLEELAEVKVTSVSKRSEKASQVAAAVHVITEEDIRRSSARSIPELLRQVPGLQVARAGSHDWAISSRGFNAQFANKLLVLIDGRTVYTPLFSGVFWDVQDTLLEDIARIEVIRGPGGTIWGANAVNGIINIITKSAKETQGAMLRASAGSHTQDTAVRYGADVGDEMHARFYASYKNVDEYERASGLGGADNWTQWRSGFRIDSELEENGSVKLQGGAYAGSEDSQLYVPSLVSPSLVSMVDDKFDVAGAHLLSKWQQTKGENEYSLQGYYDLATRQTFPFEHQTHTLDLDFNHSIATEGMHEWMWGLGYRLVHTDIESTPIINFSPAERTDNLFSAFFQDKLSLIQDELLLTLGSKFEHNDYTGFEWQPSARLTWLADKNNTFWAAVTRAVRNPSRATHDMEIAVVATPISATSNGLIRQIADQATDSEDVLVYEAGYRTRPHEDVSLDFALFYNDYKTLVADRPGAPILQSDSFYGTHVVVPFTVNDNASGETLGFEVAANWQVNDQWLLSGNFSYIDMDLNGGSTFVSSEDNTPQHQVGITSRYSFNEDIEWDNFAYYVDELGSGSSIIPAYWQLDSRLAWRPSEGIELSLVGKNLLDDRHPEFSGFVYQSQIEVPRTVFGKVTLQF